MLALLRLSSARSLMLLTLVQALDSRCFQKLPSAETNPWQSHLCRLCIIETFPKPGLGQRPRKSWSLAGSPQCVPAWSTQLDPPQPKAINFSMKPVNFQNQNPRFAGQILPKDPKSDSAWPKVACDCNSWLQPLAEVLEARRLSCQHLWRQAAHLSLLQHDKRSPESRRIATPCPFCLLRKRPKVLEQHTSNLPGLLSSFSSMAQGRTSLI